MPKDFDRPNVLDKVYKSKGWKIDTTLKEIDAYFYLFEKNYEELHNFIINNQDYESFQSKESEKEFFRLLSNFCSSITAYYNQRMHWFKKKERPDIDDLREFNLIISLRDTIVHNRKPPTKIACTFSTYGTYITRTLNKKAYLKYIEEYLNKIRFNSKIKHIKKSFEKARDVLNQYGENEIDLAVECEKCYTLLKSFNDTLRSQYETSNAQALKELHDIWEEIFAKAQGR